MVILATAPPPPGSVTINGVAEANNLSTHAASTVTVRAAIRDHPNLNGQVRMILRWSKNKDMSGGGKKTSEWGGSRTEALTMTSLTRNVHYYIRVYCEQRNLPFVSNYNSSNFWTERYPLSPTIVSPAENISIIEGASLTVDWTHRDADTPPDGQARAQIQWRVPATSTAPAGVITTQTITGTTSSFTISSTALSASTFYEWRVRTSDVHTPSQYGASSDWRSFYVIGATRPPDPVYPTNDAAVPVDVEVPFEWNFRDPSGDAQEKADIRYRVAGTEFWTTLTGDPEPGIPGATETWMLAADVLAPDYHYEWQVRTYDDSGSGVPSQWSESEFFWSIRTPGWQTAATDWFGPTEIQGALGTGTYRVFAYDQGGERYKGELTPLAALRWNRVRDDISSATLTTSGFGEDCCALLGSLRTWAHEIVVFRDGIRVWEGPITRIAFHRGEVEIEARDPMVYVYRRIMRQGYNDNYRISGGVRGHDHEFVFVPGSSARLCACGAREYGTRTVVDRSALIIANALAPWDPNVLPWLTRFDFEDDAREARAVQDWSKTAWEEVDNLAATGGLDYTTVGRRIILHDTHRPIGLLGEMREGDFFESPVITEYGMNAANVFGVTNNSGIYGSFEFPIEERAGLGPIEMIASEYGESDTTGVPEAMTAAQKAAKAKILNGQAERNIGGRWPAPLVVRVPDNARLNPKANVGINQLVPGVYIPLRATTPCREFAQMQKLDSMSVEVTPGSEAVRVVMSPAPREDIDPDAEGGDEV